MKYCRNGNNCIIFFFRGCFIGYECVFLNFYICFIYILEVDCKCRVGCRVDYIFILYGIIVIMDICGNICFCFNMYGVVSKIEFFCVMKYSEK